MSYRWEWFDEIYEFYIITNTCNEIIKNIRYKNTVRRVCTEIIINGSRLGFTHFFKKCWNGQYLNVHRLSTNRKIMLYVTRRWCGPQTRPHYCLQSRNTSLRSGLPHPELPTQNRVVTHKSISYRKKFKQKNFNISIFLRLR